MLGMRWAAPPGEVYTPDIMVTDTDWSTATFLDASSATSRPEARPASVLHLKFASSPGSASLRTSNQ